MNKYKGAVVFFIGILGVFIACNSTAVLPNQVYNQALHDSIDARILDTFIVNHTQLASIPLGGITKTASGLRYVIVSDTGKKITPTGFSNVTLSYSLRIPGQGGSAVNILDSIPNPISNVGYNVNPLHNTIPGLVEGIELIHQGGHILLFIPSSQGFRDQAVNLSFLHQDQTTTLFTIPPNSVLIFNLTLTNVASF